MSEQQPVAAIFDIGKTNKKFFLIDESYRIVYEVSQQFDEVTDEDGDACENLEALTAWVNDTFDKALQLPGYQVKAINFSTYGASFVYIDKAGKPLTPLYNYLKKYPEQLAEKLYAAYEGVDLFSKDTASPALGSLNSGLQLYRLQQQQPVIYSQTAYALHLPQYISYLLTKKAVSDITSIGCHTALWNFKQDQYHNWVHNSGIIEKLAPVAAADEVQEIEHKGRQIRVGTGLHDSSAALIPYLRNFSDAFILISTGTWCISLNPFNDEPLTAGELHADCLCYMSYQNKPVKASRLFAGQEHENITKELAAHFGVAQDFYKKVAFDYTIGQWAMEAYNNGNRFTVAGISGFDTYERAYHFFLYNLVQQQQQSTSLILGNKKTTRVFVDGGFSRNPIFMNFLAWAFPAMEVYAASVSQATAIGAALAIHEHWSSKQIAGDMVEMKLFHR